MNKDIDCVVCGSCVVDILVRPVELDRPIGADQLLRVGPIEVAAGGIVSNAGIALARLGMGVNALSYVGPDTWGGMIREIYAREGLDPSALLTHPTAATSTTAVLIDASGERSFAHCVGAPKLLDAQAFMDHLDLFARSRMMLVGYYSLLPNLEEDLPRVLCEIRRTGCLTALDAAGEGGGMSPLDRILPHLDVYVPSHAEAKHQTGEEDPERIIRRYRAAGAPGLLGVKLGAQGALLSPAAEEYVEIEAVNPPGDEVVDTTGAGDSFYAGLLTGLALGQDPAEAGGLGAATGACCTSAVGASAGVLGYDATAELAGIKQVRRSPRFE